MSEIIKSGLSVTPFSFETKSLRSVVRDGEPWFVAADVCGMLGVSNGRDAVARSDAEERASV